MQDEIQTTQDEEKKVEDDTAREKKPNQNKTQHTCCASFLYRKGIKKIRHIRQYYKIII